MHDENDRIKLSFEMEKKLLIANWEAKVGLKGHKLESATKKLITMEDEYRLNRQHKTGQGIQHEIICILEDKKGYASSDNKIDDLVKIMKCEWEQNEILPKRI